VDAIHFQISFRELRPIASTFYELVCKQTSETTAGVLPIYDRTMTSQSLQYDFYWTKMRPEINNR